AGPNAGVPLGQEQSVVDAGADTGWGMEALTIEYHGFSFSHLDGLGHAIYRERPYNDFSRDALTPEGAKQLGVEAMREGIVSRGVLVDLPRLRGVDYLDPGTIITPATLEEWEMETGVRVLEGDVLLIRIGRWARVAAEGERPLTDGA